MRASSPQPGVPRGQSHSLECVRMWTHSLCCKKTMVVISHQKRYRLPYHHVYRPGTTIFSDSSPPVVFEHVQRAHVLRYTLAQILFSIGNISRLSRSFFGIIPENSLLDKCPYYRLPNTDSAPNLPRQLKWVVSTRKKISQDRKSTKNLGNFVGCRKVYKRDRLTLPGMVVLYNTLLAWMMFNIEIGASSL